MRIIRKSFALVLILAFLSAMIPLSASATVSNSSTFSVDGLSISDDSGSTSWSVTSANSLSGSISEFRGGTSKNGTLTFTNTSGSEAVLNFDLAYYLKAGGSGGKSHIAINGTTYVTTDGAGSMSAKYQGSSSLDNMSTLSYTLAANGTVAIKVTATAGNVVSGFAKVAITNVNLKVKSTTNVTFTPDSAVSYTVGYVDGGGASQTAMVTAGASENVTVEAELSEGFTIAPTTAGYSCESSVGSASGTVFVDNNGKFTFAKNETVTPVFISTSTVKPFTHLGNNTSYATLGAAVNAGSGTVVLNQDYTLPAGNYTIPYGVTLLIPFDSANTVVTKTAENNLLNTYDATLIARSEYRKLTMSAGAQITVNGAISVSSKLANQFIGQVGAYGAIYMESGSNITVKSGGTLYAWGYIFHGSQGSGTVTVESGGTVYEPVSIMDYPGSASATTTLTDADVFPMRSYSIRNVEVPMALNSGAKEYVFSCLYGENRLVGTNPLYALLIANGTVNNETPVFQNTGTITKSYVDGRMRFSVNGNAILNSFTVKVTMGVGSYELSSSSTSGFYIPSCWDITLTSGTIQMNDNVIMCEGATFTVNQGATVTTNGKNFYILDADNDPGAVGNVTGLGAASGGSLNGCLIDVQDVHGKYYTFGPKDAVLNINGTLMASGGFYTSAAGACITSSEGGGQISVSGTSPSTSVKVKNTGGYTDVAITAARLLNGDGKYLETAKGGENTYTYTAGKWICATHTNVENITKEPTCAAVGEKTLTCSACGTVAVEEVAKVDHTYGDPVFVWEEDNKTATASVTCSKCAEGTEGRIQKLEVTMSDATVEGDCKTNAVTTYTATVTWQEEEVTDSREVAGELAEHKWTDATCSAPKTCSVCKITEGEALGHTYETQVNDATCTEDGSTVYTCTVCSDTYSEPITSQGHTPGAAATCTTPQTCTICGAELAPALNHKDDDKDHVCDNSCGVYQGTHADSDADQDHVCDYGCGAVLEDCADVPTDDNHSCDVCSKENVTEHVYTEAVTPPTCTEGGFTTYTCNCGHTYKDKLVEAQHSIQQGAAQEKTCTQDGWEAYEYCTKCSHSTKVVIPAGHTLKFVEEKAASCTEAGNLAHWLCDVCGKCFEDEQAQGEIADVTVPATNHANTKTINASEATCGEDGYTGDTYCEDCGTTIATGTSIPATGAHEYDEGVVTQEPTATVPGVMTYTCGTCGDSYTEEIPVVAETITIIHDAKGNEVAGVASATVEYDFQTNATGAKILSLGVKEGETAAAEGKYVFLVKYTLNDEENNAEKETGSKSNFIIPDGAADITVESGMLGDVSKNGRLNAKDVAMLKDLVGSSIVDMAFVAGDISGNGRINAKDVAQLKDLV